LGKSSDKIDRGGRPRQEPADRGPAENGCSEAEPGGGSHPPRSRGRPARPPLVELDTAVQAAVCSKLRSMLMDTLRAMCTMLIADHKTTKRTPKESLVNALVSMPDKLALLAAGLNIAGKPGATSPGSTYTLVPGAVESSQETADTSAALRTMLHGREVASSAAEAALPTPPLPPPPPLEVQEPTPISPSMSLFLSQDTYSYWPGYSKSPTTTTFGASGPSSGTKSVFAQVYP
jgi:hypothetical protein